jgi:hypothetical protein
MMISVDDDPWAKELREHNNLDAGLENSEALEEIDLKISKLSYSKIRFMGREVDFSMDDYIFKLSTAETQPKPG